MNTVTTFCEVSVSGIPKGKSLIIIFLISLPTLTYGNDSLKIENFTSANTKIILSRLHFSLQLEGSSFNISDPTWAHDWWLTRPFTTLVNPFSYSFLFPTLHMNPVSFSLSYNQKYFIKVRYLNFDENYNFD